MISGYRAGDSRILTMAAITLIAVCAGAVVWLVRSGHARAGLERTTASAPSSQSPLPALRSRTHQSDPASPAGAVTSAFERGVAAYNADDIDAAADAFEEAVRLAPDEAEAHINLGLVYLRLQRSDDAMREFETGAALTRGGPPPPRPQR